MTMVDWSRIRSDFPVLDQQVHGVPLIYFDSAASSQKPNAVIDAIANYYRRDHSNVHRGLHELSSRATEAYEQARAKIARFLGAAQPEEIIFTRGTTGAGRGARSSHRGGGVCVESRLPCGDEPL